MEIKEAIYWLCKCLKFHGFSNIESETFRRGKFNSDLAIQQLLILLGEITIFIKTGHINDVLRHEVKSILSDSSGAEKIKYEAYKLGYSSESLSNNQDCGSRDILLALGWLIATFKPLDVIMQSYMSQCIKDCSTVTSIEKNSEDQILVSDRDKPDHILWALGNLKYSLRSLLSVQQKRLKLLDQVRQKYAVVIPGISHLSLPHVKAVINPHFLSEHIKQTEYDNDILSCYIHWKEGETLFWQWMESVIDLMSQDHTSSSNGEISNTSAKGPEHLLRSKQGKFALNTNQPRFVSKNVKPISKPSKHVSDSKHYENKLELQVNILNKNLASLKQQCQKTFKEYSTSLPETTIIFP